MKKPKLSDIFRLAAEYTFIGIDKPFGHAAVYLGYTSYLGEWQYLDIVNYQSITNDNHRATALCLLAAIAEDDGN